MYGLSKEWVIGIRVVFIRAHVAKHIFMVCNRMSISYWTSTVGTSLFNSIRAFLFQFVPTEYDPGMLCLWQVIVYTPHCIEIYDLIWWLNSYDKQLSLWRVCKNKQFSFEVLEHALFRFFPVFCFASVVHIDQGNKCRMYSFHLPISCLFSTVG